MRSSAARVGSLPYVSPDRLEVNVLEGDVNIINEIEDPWRALCRECADDEPFYTPEWIAAHVRAFSPGATLSIVIATLDGQFLFILPLIKKWHTFQGVPVRTLSSPTNSHSCRFDAVRRLGPEGDSAVRAAWNHLRSRSDWDLLSLRETPDGGTAAALVDAAESDDLHTAGIAMRSNPLIRIPKDAESLQRLPTNSRLRGKLRHVRRELEQRGTLRLRRVSGLGAKKWTSSMNSKPLDGKEKSEVQSWRRLQPDSFTLKSPRTQDSSTTYRCIFWSWMINCSRRIWDSAIAGRTILQSLLTMRLSKNLHRAI